MALIPESLTLYKREMLIFRANLKTNIIRSVVFPLVFIVFFGTIGTASKNVPVAVVNYANNPSSLSFISDLQTNQLLQISAITDEGTALGMLQQGNVQVVVVILPTFPSRTSTSPTVQLYYSTSELTTAESSIALITSYANSFGAHSSSTQQNALPRAANSTVSSNALYSSTGSYIDFLTAGILSMVVVFGALFGGGISILSDKQSGNIKAFLITPIDKNAIVLSRIFAGATQGIIFAFVALFIGLVFGVTIAMGPLAVFYILVVVVTLGWGFSGLAMFMTSRIKRVDAYAIFAQVIGLPLWFISGGILPTSSLPSWLIPVSVIDPLTYANGITRAVVMQGSIALPQFALDLGVLVAFALIMTVIGFRSFKSTIE